MSESIRVKRLTTAAVRRIILEAAAIPSRAPNLSELFSVLVYRADKNPLPILDESPDPKRSTWGDDYRTYSSLFTILRLIPLLKACQDGEAPPGAFCALQQELNRTFSGLIVWDWENGGGWLKRRILECFEPQGIEKHFRSYCFRTNPLLQDQLGLRSLLLLPLRSPDSTNSKKSLQTIT